MSNQHVPDVGLRAILNLLTAAWGDTLLVHLYRVDHVPAAGDLVTDYVEADYEGYAAQAATTWSAALTLGPTTFTEADELAFVKGVGGTGNDVWGYYVTDAGGTVLLWAERDPAPPVDMSGDGNVYRVTPRLVLGSAPS